MFDYYVLGERCNSSFSCIIYYVLLLIIHYVCVSVFYCLCLRSGKPQNIQVIITYDAAYVFLAPWEPILTHHAVLRSRGIASTTAAWQPKQATGNTYRSSLHRILTHAITL